MSEHEEAMSEKKYRWPEIREKYEKRLGFPKRNIQSSEQLLIVTGAMLMDLLGLEEGFSYSEAEDLIDRMKAALGACAERPRVSQPVVCRHGFHVGERDPAGVFRQNTMRCHQCASELGREAQLREITAERWAKFEELGLHDPLIHAALVNIEAGNGAEACLLDLIFAQREALKEAREMLAKRLKEEVGPIRTGVTLAEFLAPDDAALHLKLSAESQRRYNAEREKLVTQEEFLQPSQEHLRDRIAVRLPSAGSRSCECGAAKVKDEPHARWCPARR